MRHKTILTLQISTDNDRAAVAIAVMEYNNNAEFGLRLDGDKVKAYAPSPVNSDALEVFIAKRRDEMLLEYHSQALAPTGSATMEATFGDWLDNKPEAMER